MTVDYLSRHLKRDIGTSELEVLMDAEIEAVRPMPAKPTTRGRVGRLRMRSLWREAGYTRTPRHVGRHRRRDRL